jgi:hypothetical protein
MSETAAASSIVVISTFLLFLGITLAITWWAARQTKGTRDFYAAGGHVTGFQNAWRSPGFHVGGHVPQESPGSPTSRGSMRRSTSSLPWWASVFC